MNGIGPKRYPYRTLSPAAKTQGTANKIYYSNTPEIDKIPCPVCGELGYCRPVEDIGLIVPYPDGRIRGSIPGGDPNVLYEIKSFCHLPLADRPPLPRAYTKRVSAATNYYDVHPDQIDPDYTDHPATPPVTEVAAPTPAEPEDDES